MNIAYNTDYMEAFLYIIVIAVAVLILMVLVRRVLTDRKLARHQKEWDERKQKCVAEGMDSIRVDDEYVRYLGDLYKTELNSFLGCCFPRE